MDEQIIMQDIDTHKQIGISSYRQRLQLSLRIRTERSSNWSFRDLIISSLCWIVKNIYHRRLNDEAVPGC